LDKLGRHGPDGFEVHTFCLQGYTFNSWERRRGWGGGGGEGDGREQSEGEAVRRRWRREKDSLGDIKFKSHETRREEVEKEEGYKHARVLTVNVKGYGIGGLNVLGSPYCRHGRCLLHWKKIIR
jgi:hypothetical protein